jgi:hypothetical protein
MSASDSRAVRGRTRKALAASAVLLAFGAVLVPATKDIAVTPVDLAARIRDREPGLVILDVRGEHFDAGLAVPGAVPVEPGQAADWPMMDAAHVVVYGIDDALSRGARTEASGAGRADALYLEGGLAGWVEDVLEPVLPEPVTAQDSATNARIADLSRYYGGRPRVGVARDTARSAEAAVQRARRRGCGPGGE